MNSFLRKKETKWINFFLAFILIFTPLVQPSYAHAEEGITSASSAPVTTSADEAISESELPSESIVPDESGVPSSENRSY